MLERIKIIFNKLKSAELRLVAASLSFSTLLSLIPFIAVSLAILQSIGGMENFTLKVHGFVLSNFKGILGEDGIFLMHKAIKRAASARIGALGAIALVVTSGRLLWDFDRAIHKVFGLKNKRTVFTRLV